LDTRDRIVVQSYEEILTGLPPERISQILSPEDTHKASRFYHKEDQDRFIAARILLWQVLETDKALTANLELPLRLDYNAHGKPGLHNCPIAFNWSHSGNLIALMVGSSSCGIDIELHNSRTLFDFESLCTTLELDWLARFIERSGYSKKDAFLVLWSAKEAALKTIGVGLSVDPRHVEISFLSDESTEWITTIDGTILKGSFKQINLKSDAYALAWCSDNRIDNVFYGNGISFS